MAFNQQYNNNNGYYNYYNDDVDDQWTEYDDYEWDRSSNKIITRNTINFKQKKSRKKKRNTMKPSSQNMKVSKHYKTGKKSKNNQMENNNMNETAKLKKSLYFYFKDNYERDSCRKHALLSIISCVFFEENPNYIINKKSKSKHLLRMKQFNKYCDLFDKNNGIDCGISREFFSVGNDSNNIFSFILKKHCNLWTGYIPMSNNSHLEFEKIINNKSNEFSITKSIIFNYKHSWSIIKINSIWFNVNSSHRKLDIISKFPSNRGYVYIKQPIK